VMRSPWRPNKDLDAAGGQTKDPEHDRQPKLKICGRLRARAGTRAPAGTPAFRLLGAARHRFHAAGAAWRPLKCPRPWPDLFSRPACRPVAARRHAPPRAPRPRWQESEARGWDAGGDAPYYTHVTIESLPLPAPCKRMAASFGCIHLAHRILLYSAAAAARPAAPLPCGGPAARLRPGTDAGPRAAAGAAAGLDTFGSR
jgi:hypothetical protein